MSKIELKVFITADESVDKLSEERIAMEISNAIRQIYESSYVIISPFSDAAMDLQLPVKFMEWATNSRIVYSATNELYLATIGKVTAEQLYNHWIENVYTP